MHKATCQRYGAVIVVEKRVQPYTRKPNKRSGIKLNCFLVRLGVPTWETQLGRPNLALTQQVAKSVM